VTHVKTPQSQCRFAIARCDITPPAGIYHRMWGAAKHDRSEGVHRPLIASVMIFGPVDEGNNGEEVQVLVALDHCLLGRDEMELLLHTIESSAGVDRSTVTVTFSHTHAAGLMMFDRQPLPGGDLIPEYLKGMSESVAALVTQCQFNLQNASIVYGVGRCSLAAHRDFWDEEGQRFVCGFDPAGQADDTVSVARVTGGGQNTLATVVNYACHPTTLAWDNQLISPDYPGAMREVVAQATSAPCVFIQGASGDLGPREGFVGDVEVADRNGRQLGYAALAALESLPPAGTQYQYEGVVESGATIGTWKHSPLTDEQLASARAWQTIRKTVDLRYRSDLPTIAQVEAELAEWTAGEQSARDNGDETTARDCRAMAERRTRMLARLRMLPKGVTFPYQVAAWRIGDAVWLAVQGEPYSMLQSELRQRFPDTPIIIASISGHWGPAYLPPAELYGKGVYQESIAVLEPGCLEQLAGCLSQVVEDLLLTAEKLE